MNASEPIAYCTKVEPLGDGAVRFDCARDPAAFRWLELPPHHPIVIQSQNYYTSVAASSALGQREEGKWTALTWTDWRVGDREASHAVRGDFKRDEIEGMLGFETRLFDERDRLVVTIRGRGVVFRRRDFEGWRARAKAEARAAAPKDDFPYLAREALALGAHEVPFIAPPERRGAQLFTRALVKRETGLSPSHRYIEGSGDHVNATHIAEVARQVWIAAHCLEGHAVQPSLPRGGAMDMHRYIELDCPFEIRAERADDSTLGLRFEQLGRDCASVELPLD